MNTFFDKIHRYNDVQYVKNWGMVERSIKK